MDKERRIHDPLRTMVDHACLRVTDDTARQIKEVARKAYYLGVGDGIQLQRDKEREHE